MKKYKWREEILFSTEFDAVIKQMEDFKKKYPDGKNFSLYGSDDGTYLECLTPLTPKELDEDQKRALELETKERNEYERLKKKYGA